MPPVYEVLESFGMDHQKTYRVRVSVRGEELGRGTGTSKKKAEQSAASNALELKQWIFMQEDWGGVG